MSEGLGGGCELNAIIALLYGSPLGALDVEGGCRTVSERYITMIIICV